NDNAMHGDRESYQGFGGGRDARYETPYRNGKVQRRTGKSRCDAGRRRAAAEFERQARPVLGTESHGSRRTLRRDERTDRRFLAVAGEVDGGSGGMGEALPESVRGRV